MARSSTPYPINEDGIAALILCLLKGWSVEDSLRYIETGIRPRRGFGKISLLDAENIRRLSKEEGVKCREIAKMYGISLKYVYAITGGYKLGG